MLKQLLVCSLALLMVAAAAAQHGKRPVHRGGSRSSAPASSSASVSSIYVARPHEVQDQNASAAPSNDGIDSAEGAGASPPQPPAPPPSLNDTAGLGAFFDGAMQVGMERHHVTGAVIALVKDGQVLMEKGYGKADIGQGTAVDPKTSLFRAGSITKLFTWTAVMQLVESGKLNLDQDVNNYLKNVHIPAGHYGTAVSLRNLMQHTAGFEDASMGFLLQLDPKRQQPILDEVRQHMPERVRPPGEITAYSNYGAALAGLIIETVSGEPYNDYIEKKIFAPLGMQHATVQEPVPAPLAKDLTTAYRFANGMELPQPFEIVGGFRPAGSASVSADDMARFMIAHLGDGGRLLKPDTLKLMHTTFFKLDQRLPGMALGFAEGDINGNEALAHGGDTLRYHSDLVLLPKENFGIFLSFITEDSAVRAEVEQAFFARYFPPKAGGPPRLDDNIAVLLAAKYSGAYQFTRRNFSDFEKVLNLASGINVTSLGNGNILVTGLARDPLQFEPFTTSGDLYREVLHGQLQVVFHSDAAGQPTHLFISSLPYMPAERTPWYENRITWIIALGVAFVVLLGALTSTYYRWQEIREMPPRQQLAVGAAVTTAGWALATALVLGVVLFGPGAENLVVHIPTALTLGLAMPIVFLGLTGWLIFETWLAWRNGYWSLARRIGYTLTPVAALVLSLFFFEWNLLGWAYG